MKHRWDFFKHSDSSFGLFYPVHYTMMAFDSHERAREAEQRLVEIAGFDEDEVASASGDFVVNEVESQEDANWFDDMRERIAELVGTECGFLDDDMRFARDGGAFVFVHTPDEDSIEKLHKEIETLEPAYARRYLHAGIERISYPEQTSPKKPLPRPNLDEM